MSQNGLSKSKDLCSLESTGKISEHRKVARMGIRAWISGGSTPSVEWIVAGGASASYFRWQSALGDLLLPHMT